MRLFPVYCEYAFIQKRVKTEITIILRTNTELKVQIMYEQMHFIHLLNKLQQNELIENKNLITHLARLRHPEYFDSAQYKLKSKERRSRVRF